MTDHNETSHNPAEEIHEAGPALENFGEEVKNDDTVARVATIAVVGVGAALISAELIPGIIIGVAASFLPGIGPKLRPFFKQTVRAGYTAMRKTREMVAEASEQMKDVVAEARADHNAKDQAAASEAAAPATAPVV